MNNNVTLFGNTMPAGVQDLLDQIDPIENLTGGNFGTNRRISIRGGVFREVVNGKEISAFDGRALNVVVLNAAALSRTFYKGKFKEGEVTPPTCWASDCKAGVPDAKVKPENKQALRCAECPQNIKGSGEGDTRACRFQQRVAIVLADEIESRAVYQLQLPATSIFGDGTKDKMPMQAYARYLQAHRTPAVAIVTEVRLDTDSSTPKLTFKPIRPLEEAELKVAIELQKHEDTLRAITFTVSEMDGVKDAVKGPSPVVVNEVAATVDDSDEIEFEAPKPQPEPAAPKATTRRRATSEAAAAPAEPVAEPTKRQSKSATPERVETANKDLKSIIAEWADDDA